MKGHLVSSNGLRVWECDVCSHRAEWSGSWQHYSSLKTIEDCGHLIVTCSMECRDSEKARILVLEFERDHRTSCKMSRA